MRAWNLECLRAFELLPRLILPSRAWCALTMHLGPTDVLLTMEIQFRPELSAGAVALAIERLDQTIRARHSDVRLIFLEAQALAASAHERA